MNKEKVLVIGASENEARFSNKAIKLLKSKGYDVFAVGRKDGLVDGVVIHGKPIPLAGVDTISLYLRPENQKEFISMIETFTYDEMGNLIEDSMDNVKGNVYKKHLYKYDQNGNMIQEGWCKSYKGLSDKNKCNYQPSVGYEYNTKNELTKKPLLTPGSLQMPRSKKTTGNLLAEILHVFLDLAPSARHNSKPYSKINFFSLLPGSLTFIIRFYSFSLFCFAFVSRRSCLSTHSFQKLTATWHFSSM